MIRLESSGSDCTMGAGFRENSVYSTYTQSDSTVACRGWPRKRATSGMDLNVFMGVLLLMGAKKPAGKAGVMVDWMVGSGEAV